MEIVITDRQAVSVAAIKGSIDSLNADQLTSTLAELIGRGRAKVVADFSAVTYASSAGLRSILTTVKHCRRLGGDLRIASLQPQVERVLSISGFTSILKVYAGIDEAADSFQAVA